MSKQIAFFDHQNYIEKVCGNNVDFSTVEIISKKRKQCRISDQQNYVEKIAYKQRAFFDQRK